MIMPGHIKNGVVVLDSPNALPEGTAVRVEVVSPTPVITEVGQGQPKRVGGQYAGQIVMAPDFDEWPDDIQEAFGMKP
jgi:hypothetical protein